jgi:serine/threonine protein kinase
MMEQMVEAVSVLHKNWLAHNDIRPSNILYSHAEGRYLLTSFSYSKVVSDISPAVALKRQNTKSKKVRLEGEEQKDYFKTDVYNLGLTFLNALFLCQPIDRKNSAPFLRELANKHPYLHILKDMLAEQEDRPSIGQVRTALLKFKTDRMSAHGKEKG